MPEELIVLEDAVAQIRVEGREAVRERTRELGDGERVVLEEKEETNLGFGGQRVAVDSRKQMTIVNLALDWRLQSALAYINRKPLSFGLPLLAAAGRLTI